MSKYCENAYYVTQISNKSQHKYYDGGYVFWSHYNSYYNTDDVCHHLRIHEMYFCFCFFCIAVRFRNHINEMNVE